MNRVRFRMVWFACLVAVVLAGAAQAAFIVEAHSSGWANATNFTGDGTVREFMQTPDGLNYFYRGVIINR